MNEQNHSKKLRYSNHVAPTKLQVEKAELMARVLNIDFPQSSYDYTSASYGAFIRQHEAEYTQKVMAKAEKAIIEGRLTKNPNEGK